MLTAVNLTIVAGNGTLLDNEDGTWSFTPATDDDTDASFAYTITDGTNNIDASAILDITPVNDAPSGADGELRTTEDTPYTLSSPDFGFNDAADGNTLDFITITSLPDTGILTHRGVTIGPGDTITAASLGAGELVYQPPFNISGPAQNSFGFTVTDNGGVTSGGQNTSIEQFISIDLTPVNDSPTLVSNGGTVAEGGTIVIDSTLLSGTDPDDIEPEELVLTVTTLPLHGQLLLNGEVVTAGSSLSLAAIEAGALRYIHDESETSADGFNVTLADGGEDDALPAQGRFELAVTEVIDPPVELAPDTLQLAFGESFDSSKGNLLASGFTSLNNGSLSNHANLLIELESPPSQGTVELMPDGSFIYVHNGSAILNDEFTYRVTNEDGIFTIATVAVTIDPPAEPAPEPDPGPEIEPAPEPAPEPEIEPALEENKNPAIDMVSFPEPVTEEAEVSITEEPADHEVVQANSEEPAQRAQLSGNNNPLLEKSSVGETDRTTGSNPVETQELPEVSNLQPDLLTLDSFAVTQHREAQKITNQSELVVSSNITYDLTLDVHVPAVRSTAVDSGLLHGLTQLDNDFLELEDESGAGYKLAEDTILGVSFSVSVGALAWALRGGAMFGSMMAFTPLWKSIEIGQVAVMVNSNKGTADNEPDEGDDSVESLFDNSA